jgi:long-chain acyl-CoA synthetase
MDLSRTLKETAGRSPEAVALIRAADGSTLSFAELDQAVDEVASGLQVMGVAKGDRVAIIMPNIPHFPIAYLGALRAGATVVPINVTLTQHELLPIFEDAGVKVVLGAPPFLAAAEAAARAVSSVERVISTEAWESLTRSEPPTPVDVAAEDVAVLAYTSGTTGKPKGAMLTHGNLRANLDQQMQVEGSNVSSSDVLLLALPLFHIFGLNVSLGLLVLNGASGVLVERFDPVAALDVIQKHRITVLFGAPTMYTAWLDTPGAEQYDMTSVRLAISGAAALAAEALSEFKSVFGVTIYEGYGMTETAPTLTSNRVAESPRPGSIGKPLPQVELRLVDDEGEDVELGDPGEILVRGPNVFSGYWNDEEATSAAFLDGWFRTGDVAVKDEEGYLYLVDRKRDLIIVSGFNVYPSEVELALMENPKTAEAAVIGEPHPYTGETVKAFVVLNDGSEATERELLDDVGTRLARFKCPTRIEIVDSLPRLLTGKVLRRALRT